MSDVKFSTFKTFVLSAIHDRDIKEQNTYKEYLHYYNFLYKKYSALGFNSLPDAKEKLLNKLNDVHTLIEKYNPNNNSAILTAINELQDYITFYSTCELHSTSNVKSVSETIKKVIPFIKSKITNNGKFTDKEFSIVYSSLRGLSKEFNKVFLSSDEQAKFCDYLWELRTIVISYNSGKLNCEDVSFKITCMCDYILQNFVNVQDFINKNVEKIISFIKDIPSSVKEISFIPDLIIRSNKYLRFKSSVLNIAKPVHIDDTLKLNDGTSYSIALNSYLSNISKYIMKLEETDEPYDTVGSYIELYSSSSVRIFEALKVV